MYLINFIDIDECEHGNDTCYINANCTNSEGSFSCSCYPGYTGDGFEACTGRHDFIVFILDTNLVLSRVCLNNQHLQSTRQNVL